MKNTIKVGLHEAEDRSLREHLKLAWIQFAGGVPVAAEEKWITLEFKDTAWDLVLYVSGQAVARTRLPIDRVWTIATLMQSAYFLGMVEQMKLMAQQDIEERAKSGLHPASREDSPAQGGARRISRWAIGIASVALVASLAAASLSVYSLKIGLSAHVNAVVAQPQVGAGMGASMGAGLGADGMGALVDMLGGGVRVDAQTLGATGIALLTEAAASTGFSLNDQGQMVVMFSDPLCPACQQFESWIAEDQYQTFSPLMVPVAFRPGAREVAAAVICSQNQAKDWEAAVAGVFPVSGAEVCEEGLQAVDRNNEIFRALGFTHTPTFVAMNGRFMVGAQSPQDMRQWAQANGSAAP